MNSACTERRTLARRKQRQRQPTASGILHGIFDRQGRITPRAVCTPTLGEATLAPALIEPLNHRQAAPNTDAEATALPAAR
jgi:hypothetical protein